MLPAGGSPYKYKSIKFPPAFLISQKSEIFDSFPPGEAFVPAAHKPQFIFRKFHQIYCISFV